MFSLALCTHPLSFPSRHFKNISPLKFSKYFSSPPYKLYILPSVTESNVTWCLFLVFFSCFVDRASLYNLFQMKPTRCTLNLSIIISTSLHASGNYVPIIRRTYCIYAALVFFVLYWWLSGLLVGTSLIPTSRPDSHPYRTKNTSIA